MQHSILHNEEEHFLGGLTDLGQAGPPQPGAHGSSNHLTGRPVVPGHVIQDLLDPLPLGLMGLVAITQVGSVTSTRSLRPKEHFYSHTRIPIWNRFGLTSQKYGLNGSL